MARGSSRTVVKRTRDEALEHIKLALRTKSCLFTKQEMSFIRTSCQILGLDSHATVRSIQEEVEDNRMKQPRKVMEYLQTRLKELAVGGGERLDTWYVYRINLQYSYDDILLFG